MQYILNIDGYTSGPYTSGECRSEVERCFPEETNWWWLEDGAGNQQAIADSDGRVLAVACPTH